MSATVSSCRALVSPQDITVAIPTVFSPPTLEPLCDSVRRSGAQLMVIEKKKLHEAWNIGLTESKTRYVIISNDDLAIVLPGGDVKVDWVYRFGQHFADGDTWVSAAPFVGLQRIFSPPVEAQVIRDCAGHWRGVSPMHRGHLFGVDKEFDQQPVPPELVLAYGDDWFYWRHQRRGTTCVALDVCFVTGKNVPSLDTPHAESGWTHGHQGFDEFLGRPVQEQLDADRAAAASIFQMTRGTTTGLREDYAKA